MPTPLVVNGVTYNYPQDFDNNNWGIDATGWAQAVTSGMLQKAGGSFPLTADVDFGASFGLKASYFETRSTNPATTGTVRLSSADAGVAFRNNANSGNLVLTTDASDNLSWGSSFLLQNTNSLKLQDTGNAHTISLHSPSVATNYSFVLPPNTGLNGQILQTDGSGNTSWVNASGTGTVNSGTAGQIAYYATSSATVSGAPFLSFTSPTLTLSTAGNTMLDIVTPTGFDSIINLTSGAKTVEIFATDTPLQFIIEDAFTPRNIIAYAASGSGLVTLTTPLALGSNQITGVANATGAGGALAWGQSFTSGNITFNPTTDGLVGTTTNDSASSGNVGEYIESVVSAFAIGSGLNNVFRDMTSISLSAGDWDVTYNATVLNQNGNTWTAVFTGISTTPGNSNIGLVLGSNEQNAQFASSSTTPVIVPMTVSSFRMSLASTTTVYAKVAVSYSAFVGNFAVYGRLSARRVR